MIQEVEFHLQVYIPRMHQGRGQAPRGHVERCLPPVIDHGLQSQPDLTDYLGPEMQRVTGILPPYERQLGPRQGDVGAIPLLG